MTARRRSFYRHLGLTLCSEVELTASECIDQTPDVTIVMGDVSRTEDAQDVMGSIAKLSAGAQVLYSADREGDGTVLLRVEGLCDFRVAASLDRVECNPWPTCPANFIPVLLTGTVSAFLLVLKGLCVLHASSVSVDGVALAIAGPSGGGKTTLATQLCAAGAELITDDVLPLDFGVDSVDVVGTSAELRLRQGASELTSRFAEPVSTRMTVDDRVALAAPRSGLELHRLAAILLPQAVSDLENVEVEQLTPMRALFELSCHTRIALQDLELLARQFQQLAVVTERVPVYRVRTPWGPPFRHDLADQILGHVLA